MKLYVVTYVGCIEYEAESVLYGVFSSDIRAQQVRAKEWGAKVHEITLDEATEVIIEKGL